MASPRQTSFIGGEFDERLWFATWLAKYGVGLRRMRNFFPIPQGAAVNRPGSQLISDRAGQDHALAFRQIPFIYSVGDQETPSQAYVVELGAGYARFIVAGGYVAPDPALYAAYDAAVQYRRGAWVSSGGVAYRRIVDSSGHQPDVSPTWWSAVNPGALPAWSAVVSYAAHALVQHGGVAYESYAGANLNHEPAEASGYWKTLDPALPAYNPAWNSTALYLTSNPARFDMTDTVAYGGVTYRCLDSGAGHAPPGALWDSPTIFELFTPYAAADLWRVQYAQQGDVVTLTCQGYTERELRRYAHERWELVELDFDVKRSTLWDHIGPENLGLDVNPGGAVAKPWKWLVTTIERDPATGLLYETLPVQVTAYATGGIPPAAYMALLPAKPAIDASHPVVAGVIYNPSALMVFFPFETNVVGFVLYRGQGKALGWINECDPVFYDFGDGTKALTNFSLSDDGSTPDYSRGPPTGTNPFKVYGGQGELLRTETAACVAYFERRRWFANLAESRATPRRPAFVTGSAVEQFLNFDKHTVSKSTDRVELNIVGQTRAEVRWLRGTSTKLLIGTSAGVFGATGPDGNAINPVDLIDVKPQSSEEEGVDWILPVVAGDEVLYVTAGGKGVRELVFDQNRGKFLGGDVTVLAEHLLRGELRITGWAYQHKPHRVFWIPRSDGKLLSLTYLKALDAWGWALHELPGGFVEDVCAIPESGETALYLGVRRTINGATKRYIERFATRNVLDARLGVFLDSSLSLDGRNAGATTVLVTETGGGYQPEAQVALAFSADVLQVGVDEGNEIVLTPDTSPVRLAILQVTGPRDAVAEVVSPAVPAALQAVATTAWARAVDELSGLEHLEGETVRVLADGVPSGDLVVAGGAVALETPAAVITVGIPYVAELELLDLAPDAEGRGKEKNVARVAVELEKSRGLQAGEPGKKFTAWKPNRDQDQVGDGPVKLYTGRAEVPISGDWNKHGRVVVRQADPLPCTVTAVTREIDIAR